MTLSDYVDIAKTIDRNANPNDIVIRLQGFLDELAMEVDVNVSSATLTLADADPYYVWADFDGVSTENFVRCLEFRIGGVRLRHVSEATYGDVAYTDDENGVWLGAIAGQGPKNHVFQRLAPDTVIEMVYVKRPAVSIDSEAIPLPFFQPCLTYRLRADMHADQSRWDRVGYYNRRYRDAFTRIKKHVRSQGGGWNIKQTQI